MRCANPACQASGRSLWEGSLIRLELEVPPDQRVRGDESGFPVCLVPNRYFWLCADCSNRFSISRWTSAELILETRAAPLPAPPPAVHSPGRQQSRGHSKQNSLSA